MMEEVRSHKHTSLSRFRYRFDMILILCASLRNFPLHSYCAAGELDDENKASGVGSEKDHRSNDIHSHWEGGGGEVCQCTEEGYLSTEGIPSCGK